ncbi:ACL072Cp [Eremothecium gossypii ATCC 10895]|uniref:ACL072Cp n=1 Tax=Eremothecium gossypii (strain ATCC 10895 / CBS 109.51 / FGSC 9923 / NRRL Y-1056) TaxID=284811 RepID=Q75CJ1_EREGS|nr:ACL072Cp [Eremothecium gossypii ATCC 10895]AAS51156.2 ACL072Cp [Eremothecium gossypii ATCC 10895]
MIAPGCEPWDYDDLTECGRALYASGYVPLGVVSACAAYVVGSVLAGGSDGAAAQAACVPDEERPLLDADLAARRYTDTGGRNLKAEHFAIEKLQLLGPDGRPHGHAEEVRRSFAERSRVAVEFLGCALLLGLSGGVWANLSIIPGPQVPLPRVSAGSNLALWTGLFVSAALRLANAGEQLAWVRALPVNLWGMSFGAYTALAATSMLPFRSVLLGHVADPAAARYYTVNFAVLLVLFLVTVTAKVGFRLPVLYRRPGGEFPSPEPMTSVAAGMTWAWLDPMIWQAHKRYLEITDVWGLRLEDYAIFVMRRFRHSARRVSGGRLYGNLFRFFFGYLALQAVWAILDGLANFLPTILLQCTLNYVEDPQSVPSSMVPIYVAGLFLSRLALALFQAQALFIGRRICIRLKAVLVSEIYTKALRRRVSPYAGVAVDKSNSPEGSPVRSANAEESKASNLGEIINLMAVDAFKVSEISSYLYFFIGSFVMVVVSMIFLYRLLGWSALVGVALLVAMLPLNYKLAQKLGNLTVVTLGFTDKRIQKLNETLQSIRIIKFFAWETNFEKEVQAIREDELATLLKRAIVWSAISFLWFMVSTIVVSASFACYIYIQGEVLTIPVAFTALSLFVMLRNPLDVLADMLSYVVQSKVSLDRIQAFLDEDETTKYEQLTISGNRLAFENATIAWNDDPSSFRLRNIDIEFMIGKLNVVIGPTGTGKSSLLLGLLGEMTLQEGKIYVPSLDPREDLVIQADGLTNSIAYCSQSAWLLNDTARSNILFNSPYNEQRYNDVLEACGLKKDFEILSGGDLTQIGEKGMTLSGGQKQRISLARALYSSARHLLLDDCLSAVDSHTALWIYENCIIGPLMEGRTCVLVSHNVALTMRNADWVVILENGRVKAQGEPLALANEGLLGEDKLIKSSIASRTNSSLSLKTPQSALNLKELDNKIRTATAENLAGNASNDDERKKVGKLVAQETKADGVVSIDVYKWFYNLFGGWKMTLALATLYLSAQCLYMSSSWWIRYWIMHDAKSQIPMISVSSTPSFGNLIRHAQGLFSQPFLFVKSLMTEHAVNSDGSKGTFYYLAIYVLIGLTTASLSALKNIISVMAGLYASRKIFNLVLWKILHAKMRFFDATPTGRIMNRLSKDLEAVDQELIPYFEGSFAAVVQCISTLVLIAYVTPQFLIMAIFIGFLYALIGYFYVTTSRELKRFESITRSPIYQHFSETLVGITSIRAYGDERRFMLENLSRIDDNNRPFFYLWIANRWLAFRVDLLGALVTFFSGLFIYLNIGKLDAGLAGISLTYAISFTEGALWFVRHYSNVEMTMNSFERLKEYMEIEQEPYNENAQLPPDNWPQHGRIDVSDLSLRYAPNLPKVIKNVNFSVEPKLKVGIVGRTGAGKSTIITAMFRFLDPETGFVKIDNIDITTIPLHRLRQSITIIPQDPTLFTGTLKSNLDPYSQYSDKQIYEALQRVNLLSDTDINSLSSPSTQSSGENINKFLDLNNEVTEGGANLSQGQRQLVCLARSLLRSPKIIMLDEATASIDYTSDEKIQQTIREEFRDSTILTIAHRLKSIIDYDKVLVMDAGEVKEYDHPYSLLLNKNTIFYNMCERTGELDDLIQASKEAFVRKLNSK